jgi:hypothetical protein
LQFVLRMTGMRLTVLVLTTKRYPVSAGSGMCIRAHSGV